MTKVTKNFGNTCQFQKRLDNIGEFAGAQMPTKLKPVESRFNMLDDDFTANDSN